MGARTTWPVNVYERKLGERGQGHIGQEKKLVKSMASGAEDLGCNPGMATILLNDLGHVKVTVPPWFLLCQMGLVLVPVLWVVRKVQWIQWQGRCLCHVSIWAGFVLE